MITIVIVVRYQISDTLGCQKVSDRENGHIEMPLNSTLMVIELPIK